MKTVFVSSTFKDMHFERDIMHARVLPELNSRAHQYGQDITFCDLRWGVNTGDLETNEGSRKVLSVCLDEIDRCRPYMVVILGERYGWIPDRELIQNAVDEKTGFELDDLEKSVTALEIEYGALSHTEQLQRTLFYFRDMEGYVPEMYRVENAEHECKLNELKYRIKKLEGGHIRSYHPVWDSENSCLTGLEHFADMLIHDISALMEQEWQEYAAFTIYEKDQRTQWNYAEQKAMQFSARGTKLKKYLTELENGTNLLAIQGAAGSGKSTLMSRLAVILDEQGVDVLPLFGGNTSMSNSAMDMIRQITYYLEEQLTLKHFEEETEATEFGRNTTVPGIKEWTQRMIDLVAQYNKQGNERIVILIDAVDQLFADEVRDKLAFIPTNLTAKVQLVFSCLDTFHIPYIHGKIFTVEPLDLDNRREVVQGVLNFHGRELEHRVIDRMIAKPAANHPLYLSLAVQRLLMMDKSDFDNILAKGDGIEAISAHQIELIEELSDTLEGVCVDILNVAAERVGGELASAAVRYLAVSRHGLRESDLSAIFTAQGMEWSSIAFSQFFKYMRNFFIMRDDGRYDFAHRSIRDGLLAMCEDQQLLHRQILEHLKSLDVRDIVRMHEIVFHCYGADDKECFVHYVDDNYENKEVIDLAAKDAHDISVGDNGAWICAVIEAEIENPRDTALLGFLLIELESTFKYSQSELLLQRQIQEDVHKLAICLEKNFHIDKYKISLPLSYERLGFINESLSGIDNLKSALKLYQKGLEIREQLVEGQNTVEHRKALSVSYIRIGGAYELLNKTENLYLALEMYQKAHTIAEEIEKERATADDQRYLAFCDEKLGDIYKTLGGTENLQQALEWHQKCFMIRKQLAEIQRVVYSWRDLGFSYNNLGDIYKALGGVENLQKALELYQKSIVIREQLAEEREVDNYRDLAVGYERLGNIYEALGGEENLQESIELYQKSLVLLEHLADEHGTALNWRDLATSYHHLGDAYKALGGTDSLQQSIELYQKSLEIWEDLAAEHGTVLDWTDLATGYGRLGDIYRELGGMENLQQALTWYQKQRFFREKLNQEEKTADNRKSLAVCYERMGFTCEQLGGGENLRQSLKLYQRVLKLLEMLAIETKTISDYDDYARALFRVAMHSNVDITTKQQNLQKMLEISEMLYQNTKNDRYQTFIEICMDELSRL